MRRRVARFSRGEAAIERLLAAGHAGRVALIDALQAVELRQQAAQRGKLRQLCGEDLVDAGRAGLALQRADALGEQARVVRLALGDDQVAGAQARIRLARRPGGVQRRPPALEGAKHVQPFDDLGPRVVHASPPAGAPAAPRLRASA